MAVTHLWDTNTAVYHLQGLFPAGAEVFISNLLKAEQPAIASISEIELLSWKASTPADLQKAKGG